MKERPLPPALRASLAELQGNPRLQLGLAAIVLILCGWMFLVLGDVRTGLIKDLQDGHERLIQVKQLAGQKAWAQRARDAEALAKGLEAEIPPARSVGLAQADFQGWLQKIVDAQGANLRVDMQAPVRDEDQHGLVRVSAVVSGGLSPRRVLQMVHRIESNTALTTLPALLVRTDGANQTFSATVQSTYLVPDATAEAKDAP